jgi:hypothetical protein
MGFTVPDGEDQSTCRLDREHGLGPHPDAPISLESDVKTAQSNMRPANPEMMLSKYAQAVTDEMHHVQVRWFASCGLGVGQNLLVEKP